MSVVYKEITIEKASREPNAYHVKFKATERAFNSNWESSGNLGTLYVVGSFLVYNVMMQHRPSGVFTSMEQAIAEFHRQYKVKPVLIKKT